jgi:hypothetical protein
MFRFTTRDLLWLMVVVGMGCGLAIQHATVRSMRSEIEFQHERLMWADLNIKSLAEGWKRDRPDRIEFERDFINVNEDQSRWSFGMPLRPK